MVSTVVDSNVLTASMGYTLLVPAKVYSMPKFMPSLSAIVPPTILPFSIICPIHNFPPVTM